MKLSTALENLLFTTVRIETRIGDGQFTSGTAFIYEFSTQDNTYPFLVTARHLIEDATEGRITLMQGQSRAPVLGKGYTLDIENFSKLWFPHPSDKLDVAVTPFVPFVKHVENSGVSVFFRALTEKSCISESRLETLQVTDDAVFLGYPYRYWDKKHLLPVYRKGMISSPISLHFRGDQQILIDAEVMKGSSGSPVFMKNKSIGNSTDGTLLGILTQLPDYQEDQDDHSPVVDIHSMGVVITMDAAVEAITAYLQEKGFI